MQISISAHRLSPNDYFKIITAHYFRRRWWLYCLVTFMFVYSLYLLFTEGQTGPFSKLRIWAPFFILSLPAYYLYNFYRFSHHSMNEAHFRNRTLTINEEKMEVLREGLPSDTITWDKISGHRISKKYFYLYISSVQVMALPLGSFERIEDMEELNNFLKSRNK